MNLLPQTRRARMRRNCGGFLDLFGGNKTSSSSTQTSVAVDSYNRSFASSRNTADSNNLTIAVGPDAANALPKSDNDVQITALKAVGIVAVLAALVAWFANRKP
jgi:hypothetical protein